MTPSERLRSLGEAATPGPWTHPDDAVFQRLFPDQGTLPGVMVVRADNTVECIASGENAAYIVACVNAMPLALDVIEATRQTACLHASCGTGPEGREWLCPRCAALAKWDNQTQEPTK